MCPYNFLLTHDTAPYQNENHITFFFKLMDDASNNFLCGWSLIFLAPGRGSDASQQTTSQSGYREMLSCFCSRTLSHGLPDVGVVTPASCHLPSQMVGQHQIMGTTPSRSGAEGFQVPAGNAGVSSHPEAVCVLCLAPAPGLLSHRLMLMSLVLTQTLLKPQVSGQRHCPHVDVCFAAGGGGRTSSPMAATSARSASRTWRPSAGPSLCTASTTTGGTRTLRASSGILSHPRLMARRGPWSTIPVGLHLTLGIPGASGELGRSPRPCVTLT